MSDASKDIAIRVEGVFKAFRLPHEKHGSFKNALINLTLHRNTYERQHVLDNISFEIQKGDFFGIVGRNGSGKSTLLKLLAGIYSPDKGSLTVNGSLTPFIELGVGFNPELTGRENIFLNGALLGFDHKEMEAMYTDIVEFAELEKFMDQKLKNYSSGMQVRLAFSIAIRARSDILLIDEVLAVGDASFQQKCYNYFEELKGQGRTVVFVSHDMGAVRRFCTAAIYIKGGKLIREGSPIEVSEQYEIDNLEAPKKTDNEADDFSRAHSIASKISKQTKDELTLEVSYSSQEKDEVYVGISVIRQGVSVAEIITSPEMGLTGSGKVAYVLNTDPLNAGTYSIAVALFRLKNRELIAIGKKKNQFMLKGRDDTKGAALKLMDTWKRLK